MQSTLCIRYHSGQCVTRWPIAYIRGRRGILEVDAADARQLIVRFSIIFLTGQIAKKPDCPVKNRTPGNPNSIGLLVIIYKWLPECISAHVVCYAQSPTDEWPINWPLICGHSTSRVH